MAYDIFKEVIPSIIGDRQGKKQFLEIEESDYNTFIINKALSNHKDCVFYANFINENHKIPNLIKYKYLYDRIRGTQRPFIPWNKRSNIENIKLICEYYKVGNIAAKQYLEILSEEQIENIRNKFNSGII